MFRVDEIAAAIAHPTRRGILVLLRSGPLSAGEIASRFDDSRPAISRHLRVLREAQLVSAAGEGREIHYTRCLDALSPLEAWLAELRAPARWQRRFDALETEVQRVRRRRTKRGQTGGDTVKGNHTAKHSHTAKHRQTKESA